MRVYALAKNHRNRNGTTMCCSCENFRRATCTIGIVARDGQMLFEHICSGCLASMHEVAVRGRKPERSS